MAVRALIVYESRVAAHDAVDGLNFGMEVQNWTRDGTTFHGEINVALDFGEAYASTNGDSIAVLGLGPVDGILTTLPAGISPREMAGTPLATHFLAVDANGSLHQFTDQGPLQNTLPIGGSYKGLTISPEGSFAYAANFISNRIDVFDNLNTVPTKATEFNTGLDPVDVTHGGAGRYIYVITNELEVNELEVYDTEDGPVIANVNPLSGGLGTLITITGSGFSAVAANNMVSFNGVMVPASSVNAAGTCPCGRSA